MLHNRREAPSLVVPGICQQTERGAANLHVITPGHRPAADPPGDSASQGRRGRSTGPGSGAGAVTLEQMLTWNPEVILLGNFDTAMPAEMVLSPEEG